MKKSALKEINEDDNYLRKILEERKRLQIELTNVLVNIQTQLDKVKFFIGGNKNDSR